MLFIVVCLLLASCSHDRYRNSLLKLSLKGKVKTMEQTEYKVKSANAKNDDDSALNKGAWHFNNRGNISEEITWLTNDHQKKCVYKFDESGRPAQSLKYNDDSSFAYKTLFIYDADGLLTGQNQYDGKDSLNLTMRYVYDAKGNVTEETSRWVTGKLLRKNVFTYNDKEQEIACSFFNADSNIVMRVTYAYNDSGYKVEEHKYGEDDTDGWVTQYRYDAYDKQGNWLKRTTFVKDKPVSITVRSITYY